MRWSADPTSSYLLVLVWLPHIFATSLLHIYLCRFFLYPSSFFHPSHSTSTYLAMTVHTPFAAVLTSFSPDIIERIRAFLSGQNGATSDNGHSSSDQTQGRQDNSADASTAGVSASTAMGSGLDQGLNLDINQVLVNEYQPHHSISVGVHSVRTLPYTVNDLLLVVYPLKDTREADWSRLLHLGPGIPDASCNSLALGCYKIAAIMRRSSGQPLTLIAPSGRPSIPATRSDHLAWITYHTRPVSLCLTDQSFATYDCVPSCHRTRCDRDHSYRCSSFRSSFSVSTKPHSWTRSSWQYFCWARGQVFFHGSWRRGHTSRCRCRFQFRKYHRDIPC
jgi:hypothetical protein